MVAWTVLVSPIYNDVFKKCKVLKASPSAQLRAQNAPFKGDAVNKTIPSYETSATERELKPSVQAPVSTGGCCSAEKPKQDANQGQPAEVKSGCCCH
jgi:hypothetical protein